VGNHVLLIEDNSTNRQMLKDRFALEGTQVAEAETGKAGLAMATRSLPQAIIISTTLPDMTGDDVAQHLRSMTRTHHIYLMLLADENVHRERLSSLELGADDFVASPFDPDEVVLRIRNALRRANSSNRMDPVTGLPAGGLVQEQMRRLLKDPTGDWALLRFHVTGLDPLREVHGFQAANDLLRDITSLLAEALSMDKIEDDFLGYIGNDDFMVITHRNRAPSLKAEILEQFEKKRNAYYSPKDRKKGYILLKGEQAPMASLHVQRITPENGPFYDIRSLSESLTG